MTSGEQKYVAFLRSRFTTLLLILAGGVMTLCAPTFLPPVELPASADAIAWSAPVEIPAWGTVALLLAVTFNLYYINRRYNILRTTRAVYAGMFMLMCGAAPLAPGEALASCLLALSLLCTMSVYYALYHRPGDRRQVFLIGVMSGIMILIHKASALYIPVFIIALTQMRIFSIRSVLALFVGILTPAWILWAIFDIDFNFNFSLWTESPLEFFRRPGLWRPLAAAIVTLITGFMMGLMVLIKVLTLNARARALNGFITLLAIWSGIFLLVDYQNIYFYLTILNATVALQIAHFFRLNRHRSGYISLTLLIIAYAAIYLWPSTLL